MFAAVTGSEGVPPIFGIEVTERGDALLIALQGEIDLLTAPRVTEELDRRREDHRLVAVDLRDVSFMDSMGVRVVFSMKVQAETDGFDLVLVADEEAPARRVIRVAQMDDMFRWERQPPEALG
jgi:anti-anti-sigma factor